MRMIRRPKSDLAPGGRCRIAHSRSSRASFIPGEQNSEASKYRPGCAKARSTRVSASATALGHISWSSTLRIAARVRAETPRTFRTGHCHRGRHRSARTALGRLRGIALSDQHEAILPPLGTCLGLDPPAGVPCLSVLAQILSGVSGSEWSRSILRSSGIRLGRRAAA